MKKRILFSTGLFLVLMCYVIIARADKTKQALRALDKQDYEKVEDILSKSIAEDSINPATEYIWALLYTREDFPRYDLDSAHYFIQLACQHIQLQHEDHLDELDDADLSEYDLKNKKLAIDSMAFVRADSIHTFKSYNHFIKYYEDAADYDQAVAARNVIVFTEVKSQHTWKAYKQFIQDYPDAAQIEKARIQYDKLIYEDKTSSGDVTDLEQFLIDEPKTPYRHTVEKKVFEEYINLMDTKRMVSFLDRYKNPILSSRILGLLFHLEGFDFSNVVPYARDLQTNYMDSVGSLSAINQKAWSVILEDNRYVFVDLHGNKILNQGFDNVLPAYTCGNILDDLLQVQEGNLHKLINRNSEVILNGYSGQFEDLGSGFLAIRENDKYGLMHKSGFRLLPANYDRLELLQNRVLIFESEGKVGIMGISGSEILPAIFDGIEEIGPFLIFERNERFGISRLDKILAEPISAFSIDCKYEEVELIGQQYIIGFEENEEVLIDKNLEVKTPPDTRRINTRYDTWVMELPQGYTTFDPENGILADQFHESVLQNSEWLGLTRNGKWLVYYKNISDEPIVGVDSLKLLGEDIAIIFRGSSGMAIFPNKKIVQIVENQFLKSIGPKIKTDQHFLVIKKGGENVLYRDGVELFRLVCDELGYISDSAFYIKNNGRYGAVGLDGRLIMRIRYDAISQAIDEVAPVLYNGKFGAYNFRDRILLNLEYQHKLKPYNSNLFLVNEKGQFGLLDRFNELHVAPAYDQIKYWSDSSFLGKKQGVWQLVQLKDQSTILTDIAYFEFILNTAETKIFLFQKEGKYGVYHQSKGVIVPPVFHDIINLGNEDEQLYFAETHVPEADMYVVVYYDSNGNKLFSEAYRSEAYDRIICEN